MKCFFIVCIPHWVLCSSASSLALQPVAFGLANLLIIRVIPGVGEMTQWLTVLLALPEDLILVPVTLSCSPPNVASVLEAWRIRIQTSTPSAIYV